MTFSFNLQWLSLPFFGYGLYSIGSGIVSYLSAPKADIGPLIGMYALWNGAWYGIIGLAVGGLILMAFRK